MHKKLMMACMAIAVFAVFVMAPAASATNFTENGATLAKGASITALNNGEIKFTAGVETTACTFGHMTGTLTEDAGGKIKIEIPAGNAVFKGTAEKEDCAGGDLGAVKATANSKLCIEVNNSDSASLTGCGAEVTFKIDVTSGMTCAYNSPSVTGLITTAPTDARFITTEQPVKRENGQSFLCPAELKLDMDFVLSTTDATTLLFS